MSDIDPQDPPIMPHVPNPALNRLVRENLRRLADQTEDTALRERITAVVEGRAGLRELAFNARFQQFLEPLVEQGLRRWESLSPAEQRDLGERGLRGEGFEDSGGSQGSGGSGGSGGSDSSEGPGDTGGETPSGPPGTDTPHPPRPAHPPEGGTW